MRPILNIKSPEKLRLLLVWPFGFDTKYVLPLALAYLVGNLNRDTTDVKIIDGSFCSLDASNPRMEAMIRDYNPNVVGISGWAATGREVLKVLSLVKAVNKEIITVLGGIYATTGTDDFLAHDFIDFVIRGEAELSFPRFLSAIRTESPDFSQIRGLSYRKEDGTVAINEVDLSENLDAINLPDYDAINLEGYIKKGYRYNTPYKHNAPIWVTRGCPYSCTFCSAYALNGHRIRKHSVPYLIKWIRHLHDVKHISNINIIDDNFTFDVNYAKEVCRAIVALGMKDLHLGTPNGIRIQKCDDELLMLMKQAGWEHIVIAPESGSRHVLQLMKKSLDPDIIPEKVNMIRRAGMKVHCLFLIGYPGETEADLNMTIRLLRRCRCNLFSLSNFQPLQGTPIYDTLLKSGEISSGLMPENVSDGKRSYTPKELRHINFPALIIREYLRFMLVNPLNIPYVLRTVSPQLIMEKLFKNIRNIFAPKQ